MRLLLIIVLIIAGVAGLGLYRGWFHLTSDGSVNEPAVTVTVDKDKIQHDKNDAKKTVDDLKHQ